MNGTGMDDFVATAGENQREQPQVEQPQVEQPQRQSLIERMASMLP